MFSHRDQRVHGERRDFHEDECVERITGNRNAQQAGQAQQVHTVEPASAARVDFAFDAVTGVDHDQRARPRDQKEDKRAEDINAIFDAVWRSPSAKRVGNWSARQNLMEQSGRG